MAYIRLRFQNLASWLFCGGWHVCVRHHIHPNFHEIPTGKTGISLPDADL